MSAGYASRLSDYKHKGVCGLPEFCETQRSLTLKLNRLAKLVMQSKSLVVLTGAGISTSSGIPDFRGPKGIWTLEKKQQKSSRSNKRSKLSSSKDEARQQGTLTEVTDNNGIPPLNEAAKHSAGSKKRSRDERTVAGKGTSPQNQPQPGDDIDFASARPTLTHRAITKLASEGIVKYCITQNVDGLHRRSGLKRSHHAVLHGCVFTEKCDGCGAEHFRNFDVGGMSFQKTGRKCDSCDEGDLRDTMLDWEDELPEIDFARATEQCEQSDLVLCLGTSLRIEPAGSLPTLAKKFVIVNLQETPYDNRATIVVRAPVDVVMRDLMEKLGYEDWEDHMPPVEAVWHPDDSIPSAETSM